MLEAVHSTFAQLSVASRNFRQPDFVQLLHLLPLRRLAAREGTVPLRSLADLDQLCVMHRAFVLAMRSAAVFACWMPACFAMFDYIPGTLSVKLVLVFPDMAFGGSSASSGGGGISRARRFQGTAASSSADGVSSALAIRGCSGVQRRKWCFQGAGDSGIQRRG